MFLIVGRTINFDTKRNCADVELSFFLSRLEVTQIATAINSGTYSTLAISAEQEDIEATSKKPPDETGDFFMIYTCYVRFR